VRRKIAVTTCGQCKRGWQDGGGVTVEMSPPAIEAARCDAQHIGSIDGADTPRATQTIPPAKRRRFCIAITGAAASRVVGPE